jgi:hypothetical protein
MAGSGPETKPPEAKPEAKAGPKTKPRAVKLKGREEPVPVPTGDFSMRAVKDGFHRNGLVLGTYPKNFNAEELKWSDDQWREALGDAAIIFGDPVTDGENRFRALNEEKARVAGMFQGGTPGGRSGGDGNETNIPEGAGEDD